jgi:F-type H+-transporting ATPase subunit b
VLGTLDGRAEKIRTDLDEAQRLHDEAKALLAKYQAQLQHGEALAADIVAQAETQRQRFEEKMRADFDLAVKRRTELAMERIAQEESRALQDVRSRAADLAVRTTRRLLSEKVGAGEAQSLIQGAIEEVKRKLA